MTCVVGLVNRGKIYIGADSAGSDGHTVTIRRDVKVFKNGDYLMGFTSSFRLGDLLKYAFKPPRYEDYYQLSSDHIPFEEFMVTKFIPALKDCLKNGGYATKNYEADYGGCFLVGYWSRLFRIDHDYQVGESIDGYQAIGCGADVATGALFVTRQCKPEERVKKALQASAYHCNSVRAPFHVLGSDGREY